MSEKLFRGKRLDNKKWANRYYLPSNTALKTLGQSTGLYDSTKWEELTETEKEAWLIRHTADEWKGKLIFEDDILQCNNNQNDLIVVVFGEFDVIDMESLKKIDRVIGWHYEVVTTDALSKCEPFCLPMPLTEFYIERMDAKVIGNIWDNPELIEEWEDE